MYVCDLIAYLCIRLVTLGCLNYNTKLRKRSLPCPSLNSFIQLLKAPVMFRLEILLGRECRSVIMRLVFDSLRVGLWKTIRKWEKFLCLTRFEVRDGSMISFWRDQWCGNVALKVAFPVLFGIAHTKDTFVAVNLEFLGGSNQWNVSFARAAHDWEIDVFASFL